MPGSRAAVPVVSHCSTEVQIRVGQVHLSHSRGHSHTIS